MLDPAMAAAIARKIGIPPGLLSCFELEMARLQVSLLRKVVGANNHQADGALMSSIAFNCFKYFYFQAENAASWCY